jgi:2-oxo-3-hexenedioate decarboxylase
MEMPDEAVLHALAEELERARVHVRAIEPPPALAGLPLAGGYAIQDALVALRVATGAEVAGWKLGITSPVKQRVMGIDHPLFGRIFAAGERAGDDEVRHAEHIAPRVEPELAFGLAVPLDPAMDEPALAAAVAWIAPALEITDSRFHARQRTAVELVADNTSASAYAIGPRIAAPFTAAFGSYPTELVRNGDVVARGSTADVLGDPLRALAALAAHVAARGLRTVPGQIVLSGAITDAVAIVPGDVLEARLRGLGAVAVRFV